MKKKEKEGEGEVRVVVRNSFVGFHFVSSLLRC